MRTHKVVTILTVVAVAIIAVCLPRRHSSPSRNAIVSPLLKVGSAAVNVGVVGANYGLFTCQVGRSPNVCYDPYQVRHAYNINSLINAGYDGSGKTIVIIDAFQSPNIVQQLNFYNSFYGLPSLNGLGGPPNPRLGTFTQIAPEGLPPFDPTNSDMIGWAEEISLDVLWSHAIAPGANIVLVLARSDGDVDILSATKYAVDHRLGDVISQSFGENENCLDPDLLAQQHQIFADATMKNMTVLASSGDFGSALPNCDGSALVQAVSNPASDPLVTSVGGTELHAAPYCLTSLGCNPATNPAPGTYQGEIVWNEPNIGAGGGGFSVVYDEPSYQNGTIHGGKQRGLPDVSYSAAVLHGLLTYLNIPGIPAGFYLFGGTSAGSPQWAAITAIADQKAGYSLGFINKSLYHIGQAPAHFAESFHDVTSGNNSFFGVPGFSAGAGWDPASGFGSPNAADLVNYITQFTSPGDGVSAVAESKPHSSSGASARRGHMEPH
jgi:subtilase family serine protease